MGQSKPHTQKASQQGNTANSRGWRSVEFLNATGAVHTETAVPAFGCNNNQTGQKGAHKPAK